jgi:hypothetical protein
MSQRNQNDDADDSDYIDDRSQMEDEDIEVRRTARSYTEDESHKCYIEDWSQMK